MDGRLHISARLRVILLSGLGKDPHRIRRKAVLQPFGAERILDNVPDVDTIVCATDDIAFGALMCMREYGKRVPGDVQVTGVGDSLLSQITRPSLTTVHLFYKTSGVRAAQMLLAKIDGSEDGAQEIKMPYEVYGRMSMR